jgi:methylated-DNA-[protein]-cysteine S-methyltransferase
MKNPGYTLTIESPVGWWALHSTETDITALDYAGTNAPEETPRSAETKLEKRLECMLSRYFRGELVDFSRVPVLFPSQPPLLQKVMMAIQTIPYGELQSYQWVAEALGNPNATRAVGGALGRNPVPIIIPCHRIIAKNAQLGGFMRNHPDGSRIKTFLLSLEGHQFNNGRLLSEAGQIALPLL